MFEIYLIQDLSGQWPGAETLYDVLDDLEGTEDIVFVDTDPSNQAFIDTLGLKDGPAIVFIKPLGGTTHVVLDRIQDPVRKTDLERRYRAARNSILTLGDIDGVPAGDIIDLNRKRGNDGENDPFGFGLLNFNINLPRWAWLVLAGAATYKGLSSRKWKGLWFGAAGYSAYKGLQNS